MGIGAVSGMILASLSPRADVDLPVLSFTPLHAPMRPTVSVVTGRPCRELANTPAQEPEDRWPRWWRRPRWGREALSGYLPVEHELVLISTISRYLAGLLALVTGIWLLAGHASVALPFLIGAALSALLTVRANPRPIVINLHGTNPVVRVRVHRRFATSLP